MLCKGESDEFPMERKAALKLGAAGDYRYLSFGGELTVSSIDDAAEFRDVTSALRIVGITPEVQNLIWRTLAGILEVR